MAQMTVGLYEILGINGETFKNKYDFFFIFYDKIIVFNVDFYLMFHVTYNNTLINISYFI